MARSANTTVRYARGHSKVSCQLNAQRATAALAEGNSVKPTALAAPRTVFSLSLANPIGRDCCEREREREKERERERERVLRGLGPASLAEYFKPRRVSLLHERRGEGGAVFVFISLRIDKEKFLLWFPFILL